ncbi:MAG TPA: 2-amino-4-oxopentanoate thiolase subunit OrtA, partial [Peptostreptococcaceae bacterium]|nr:2-amino-4-oxopentanoate thiolase subunit OrtA [Peptostreptococcaceae bacterium]
NKGDWVLVHNIILDPANRSPQVPEDTKSVPLEMWVKGFIHSDAKKGYEVRVTTITGREVDGKLVDVNPYYKHDYGKFVPEILQIGLQVKEVLFGGDSNE